MECLYCGEMLEISGRKTLFWQTDFSKVLKEASDIGGTEYVAYLKSKRKFPGNISYLSNYNTDNAVRLCPRCGGIAPAVKANEELIRIGLMGMPNSGKTAFLCSFAANNFGVCKGKSENRRFSFYRMQRESSNLEKMLVDPNENSADEMADVLHDEFMLQVLRFSQGKIAGPTPSQPPYPFFVRVEDQSNEISKILAFYDISGKLLEEYAKGKKGSLNPCCFCDFDWIYYFVDGAHVFSDHYEQALEEDCEFIRYYEGLFHNSGKKRYGTGIILTKMDAVKDNKIKQILIAQNTSDYNPEEECIRSYFLLKNPAARKLQNLLAAEEHKYVPLHMVSAVGCEVDEKFMKKNKAAKAQYMTSPVYDLLFRLIE